MARAMVQIWACSMMILAAANLGEGIGVNWGTQASQNLHPSVVAQLLKDNKINKVKLFDADDWTVKYFAGTGIEVMVGIPNNQLSRFSDDYDEAKDWVKENVTKHLYNGGVNIKHVAVGNEPFLKAYNGSFLKTTFPALQNIQKALNAAGVGDKIKATVPQNGDVYDSGTQGPSAGNFRRDIRKLMTQIVHFMRDNDCPFVVNIYPFLSLYLNPNFPVDFAFFEGGAKPVVDKNIQYTNMFDANLDTLIWSLRKTGAPKMKVIVGEIGWPTDGNSNANVELAHRFYRGFLKKMATNKGTPLRPGPIDTYLFSLTDENQKSIAPGDFERHWGIFRYDGKPKFPVDFTGKDEDKMPVAAKNVQYLPAQWCVFNNNVKNMSLVGSNVGYACSLSDCTSLGYGSSCNKLDLHGNISYAFNMYYQMNSQDVDACDFQGLAHVVTRNASKDGCLFPVQMVSDGRRGKIVNSLTVIAGLITLILFGLF